MKRSAMVSLGMVVAVVSLSSCMMKQNTSHQASQFSFLGNGEEKEDKRKPMLPRKTKTPFSRLLDEAVVISDKRSKSALHSERVDARIPGGQNFETTIMVSDHGETLNQDKVVAMWMSFLPESRSDSRLVAYSGLATSEDGGEHFAYQQMEHAGEETYGRAHWPLDPMHAVDRATGTLYLGGLIRGGVESNQHIWLRKDPNVEALSNPMQPIQHVFLNDGLASSSMLDKPWMTSSNVTAGVLHLSYYFTFLGEVDPDIGIRSGCALRTARDHGVTMEWGSPRVISGCVQAPLPRVGFRDSLYIFFPSRNRLGVYGAGYTMSSNLGRGLKPTQQVHDWSVPFIRMMDAAPAVRVAPFVIGAIAPRSGRLYMAYADVTQSVGGEDDLDIVLTYSDDGGANWTAPRIVTPDPVPFADQFMPWIEVDENDRLHMIWMDTRHRVMPDSSNRGYFDVYYGRSEDGGASWRTARLTNTTIDSDQTDANLYGGGPSRRLPFVGDYMSMAISRHAAYVAHPGSDGSDGLGMFVSRIELGGF